MEVAEITGRTIVFDDAYTGVEKYGRIDRVYGDEAIVHIISKEKAGPNPRRVKMKPDDRIAEMTSGTGVIE
jgi:hypothetical protein